MESRWRALVPGSVVQIIAPGSGTSLAELKKAEAYLSDLGLEVFVDSKILGGSQLFAAPDRERFRQLKAALLDPQVDGIWCLRGGYGALRLLPELRKLRKPRSSKVFLGYSDIVSLHGFLNLQWGWSTLHAPNLDRFAQLKDKKTDRLELESVIFGLQSEIEFGKLKALNSAARKKVGKVKGFIRGGNLCVTHSSLGTPNELSGRGAILFFEDRGEKTHRVDRMLEQIRQSRMLRGARAILFGDLEYQGSGNHQSRIWRDVIPAFANSLNLPVFSGLPVGHGARQRVLPMETPAVINLKSRRLKVQSGSKS